MWNSAVFLFITCSIVCFSSHHAINASSNSFEHHWNEFSIKVDNIDQGTVYTVHKFDRIIQQVALGVDFGQELTKNETDSGFILQGNDQTIRFEVIEDSNKFSLLKVNASVDIDFSQLIEHCFDLRTGNLHWFGGPQLDHQEWPIENLRFENFSYVPKQEDRVSIAERYWLHSDGGFIYIDDRVPLFINQNLNGNTICFVAKKEHPYSTRRKNIDLVYYLGSAPDAKIAQQQAVKHFLKKPTAVADRGMVQYPIWSTWARYKKDINETSVEQFASEIEKYGFPNGQLEIDDGWEICYGEFRFWYSKRFPNIKKQTDGLRARGFRVKLWVHPFVNKDCYIWYGEGRISGYLVSDHRGEMDTVWWNSKENGTAMVDFTNKNAALWYIKRLKELQHDAGIDGFKFDAGETSWMPKDPKLRVSFDDHPLAITKAYIRTASEFGPITEVRTGHGTQDLPIFVRWFDKDTEWTSGKNGLPTVITTLLQMNMVGYGFILPDMIGGNGYNGAPSEELFIRWLQANVFMPCLQFSYAPWDYSEDAINISKTFVELHADYTDEIMKAFEEAVKSGEPVNPPIWWLDPHDKVALSINDEFLLGDRILSAPVIGKGDTSRDVYLPKGTWYDPNLNETYEGPTWLKAYPAAIDVLPYFIRQNVYSTEPLAGGAASRLRSFGSVLYLSFTIYLFVVVKQIFHF